MIMFKQIIKKEVNIYIYIPTYITVYNMQILLMRIYDKGKKKDR